MSNNISPLTVTSSVIFNTASTSSSTINPSYLTISPQYITTTGTSGFGFFDYNYIESYLKNFYNYYKEIPTYSDGRYLAALYSCAILSIIKLRLEKKVDIKNNIITLDKNTYNLFLESFHKTQERNIELEMELYQLKKEKFKNHGTL